MLYHVVEVSSLPVTTFIYVLCREKLPFVSTFTHSKLLLRAANLDDVKLLKQCIDDRTNIAKVSTASCFICSGIISKNSLQIKTLLKVVKMFHNVQKPNKM